MENLQKIRKFSTRIYIVLSILLVAAPMYYVLYWALINHLPDRLISVNTPHLPLSQHHLTVKLQLTGFAVSLLPLSALVYGLTNMRKIFSYYKEGLIFSIEHARYFKNSANALLAWVVCSILYKSAKSVIFSLGNPPGSRVLEIQFTNAEFIPLMIGVIVYVIAWVMDEARAAEEENRLTI